MARFLPWRRPRTSAATVWLLLSLLVVAASFATPALSEEGDAPPLWRDTSRLTPLFEEALEAVEGIEGAPFETRPTLTLTSRDELEMILRRELRPQFVVLEQLESLDLMAKAYARTLIAKYEPTTHVIHWSPVRFEDDEVSLLEDGEIDEDFVRVLLAHEATHAYDWPRYGWAEKLTKLSSRDAAMALNAVVEGHAQLVARQAADAWGIPSTFESVTQAILGPSVGDDPTTRSLAAVLRTELSFAYVKGQAFMEAVLAAKGRDGVEAVLQDPPTSTRAIEHPERVIDPARVTTDDLDIVRALDAFQPLVGDPIWTTTRTRVKEASLRALMPIVPEDQRAAYLDGYTNGHVLVGQVPAEGRQCLGMLLLFDTQAHAEAFAVTERAIQEFKDRTELPGGLEITSAVYEDGAGADGVLPGFRVTKVVSVRGAETVVSSHTFVLGSLFGQILRVGTPEIDHEAESAAIARLQRYLEDPEKADTAEIFNVAALPITPKTRKLVLQVTDTNGRPVPGARVFFLHQGEGVSDPREVMENGSAVQVCDGKAILHVPKEATSISFWVFWARDEAGEALDLAPFVEEDVEILEVDFERTVAMKPGARISGRVVDADGHPLEGMAIRARPRRDDEAVASWGPMGRLPHGQATSDEEGAFSLRGLEPEKIYAIEVAGDGDRPPTQDLQAVAGATDLRIEIQRGVRVVLEVVDPDGKPVRGAVVDLFADTTCWDGRTDLEGKVHLPALSPGEALNLKVTPPDDREYLAAAKRISWTPRSERLQLPRGFTVHGVVRDEAGEPVPKAVVRAAPCRAPHAVLHENMATSDVEGAFVLRHLPYEAVCLWVSGRHKDPGRPHFGIRDAHRPARGWKKASPEAPEAELIYRPPPTVRVRVLDPDGHGVSRAKMALGHSGWTSSRVYDADAEGWMVLEIPDPSQPFVIAVIDASSSKGQRPPFAPTQQEFKKGTREVTLDLEIGHSIRGRVVDAGGEPVARAKIIAKPATMPPTDSPDLLASYLKFYATTDAEGRFEIVGLSERPHDLHAEHADHPGARFPDIAAGTQDVEVRFPAGRRVEIRVLDAEGAPLGAARVRIAETTILANGGSRTRHLTVGRTDGKGLYQTSSLSADGRYGLQVDPPASSRTLLPAQRDWKAHDTTIRLERGFLVTGTVLDQDGEAAPHVEVKWVARTGRGSSREKRTGPEGHFEAGPFPLGPVRVWALLPKDAVWEDGDGYVPMSERAGKSVRATPEAPDVVLHLPTTPIAVRIHVRGGRAGGTLSLRSEAATDGGDTGRDVAITDLRLDENGVATLKRRVPPGLYAVIGERGADDRMPYRRRIRVPEDLEANGVLGVERVPVLTLRVRLLLPADTRYPEVRLLDSLLRREGREVKECVYEIRGLPPGTWTIKVKARGPDAWLTEEVQAEAGKEIEVDLR